MAQFFESDERLGGLGAADSALKLQSCLGLAFSLGVQTQVMVSVSEGHP